MSNRETKKTLQWIIPLSYVFVCCYFLLFTGCNFFNNNERTETEFKAKLYRAQQCILKGKIDDAEKTLNDMKVETKKLGQDSYLVGWWHFLRGKICTEKELPEQAEDEYVKALTIFKRDGTKPNWVGATYVKYTSVLYQLGDLEKAKIYISRGLSDLTTSKYAEVKSDDGELLRYRVRLLLLQAEILICEDHLDEADVLLQKIVPNLNAFPHGKYEAAKFSNLLGVLNFKQGHFPDADICFTEALKIVEENRLEEYIETGSIVFRLGIINYKRRKFDQAIVYFQKANKIYESRPPGWNDLDYQTKIWLGRAYFKKQDYPKARCYYESVIDSLEALPRLSEERRHMLKIAISERKNSLREIEDSHR